jgi:hypothetical protein
VFYGGTVVKDTVGKTKGKQGRKKEQKVTVEEKSV